MSNYIVTNIRLPKEDLVHYRQIALASGRSFSELVRELLARNLYPVEVPKTKKKKYPRFREIEKVAVSGGPRDGSTKHDRYIY